MKHPVLNLGAWRRLNGAVGGPILRLPTSHLVTHGVVVGMTGSGKTGLLTVLAEEALSAGVPTLIIDVKGDLPNLLLTFPELSSEHFVPWFDRGDLTSARAEAEQAAQAQRAAFTTWGLTEAQLAAFKQNTSLRVLTPGATSGEPLHMFSALERRSPRWDTDVESARAALSAAVSLVLRLLGRDPDPARSKDHVLLSVLAERRLLAAPNGATPPSAANAAAAPSSDSPLSLALLMEDLQHPPIDRVGALPLASFMSKAERGRLAAALNTLLASPTFSLWRQGAALDVGEWLTPREGRTPAVIVSVAHLDDEERQLVLGVLFEEVLSWVRGLPGSQRLEAMVLFDEIYGFMPPYPANPPTKRPLVSLMKQARAFGVGVVVATQNPMDLDYRALSNAGVWCVGRLQTDADRARVLDGLCGGSDAGLPPSAELGRILQRLAPRWFLVRNSHAAAGPLLVQPRQTLSWLRGPMTRRELERARAAHSAGLIAAAASAAPLLNASAV